MHCNRPHIAFTLCKLSRYRSNPSKDHWKEITKVFGYLKKIMNLGLFYNNLPLYIKVILMIVG